MMWKYYINIFVKRFKVYITIIDKEIETSGRVMHGGQNWTKKGTDLPDP